MGEPPHPKPPGSPRAAADPHRERAPATRDPADITPDPELPIVARLVVEVRSDGSRTITRGAIEDAISGETVAVEARADSPLELSMNLAKMLLQAPALASQGVRAGLPTAADLRKAARRRIGRIGRRLRSRLRGDDPDAGEPG